MRSQHNKPPIIVITDGRTMDVVHVYVGTSKQEAMRAFLKTQQGGLDASYSDAREELTAILDRYLLTEMTPSQITIRRGL